MPLTPKQCHIKEVETQTRVKGKEKVTEMGEVFCDEGDNGWSDYDSDNDDPNYVGTETEDSESVRSLDAEDPETDDELENIKKK